MKAEWALMIVTMAKAKTGDHDSTAACEKGRTYVAN